MIRWLMSVSILCLVIPEGLTAQTPDRRQAVAQRVASLNPVGLRSNTVLPVAERLVRTEMWFARSQGNPVAQAGTSTRSPVLAGGLSLVLPLVGVNGIGSFYAGNPSHGRRHLLLGFASIGTMLAGVGGCVEGIAGGCSGASESIMIIGGVAYLGNWAWSILTAVLDAGEYNRRQSETRAARLEPGFKILTAFTLSTSTTPERHRLGLQLARLAF